MKYSRLDRKKNPPDIIFKGHGGLSDAMDDAIKEIFLITDKEYDILCEKFSEREMSIFIDVLTGDISYKCVKQLLLSINKHLDN